MDERTLRRAFRRARVDPSALSTRSQVELALRFSELYERRGLLRDGMTPPLWRCCPRSDACWRGLLSARPMGGEEDGGIAPPWIGPDYQAGSVLVLGINHNDASGIAVAFQMGIADAEELSDGRYLLYRSETYRGSSYPYCTTRSAALLLDYLDGEEPRDRERPQDLVAPVNRLMRLQSIKCSPRAGVSEPTNEMWFECPPLLLRDELRLAEPGAVLGFGANVRWVLEQVGLVSEAAGDRLHRGQLTVDGRSCEVFLLDHPHYRHGWNHGHASLAALLSQRIERS